MKISYKEVGSEFITANDELFNLLIVTATETEKKELHQYLKPLPEEDKIIKVSKDKQTYFLGTFGAYPAVHVACDDMGAVSRNGSITTTMHAISLWKPKAVLMVGIAFGIDKKKQKIGDVLVAERIVAYESQRVGIKVIPRGKEGPASSVLVNRFKSVTDWEYKVGARTPQIISGLILSGEKLIDDQEFRDELLKAEPTAIGGEMEGAGIYAACDGQVHHWILVKAICDYADGNKSKKKAHNQKVAISSAVNLCEHVFSSPYGFDDILTTTAPKKIVDKLSTSKKKVHEALKIQTNRQIKKQINSGKYIPDTFIEMGRQKDLLRNMAHPALFAEKCLKEIEVLDFSALEKRLKKLALPPFSFDPSLFKFEPKQVNITNISEHAQNWLENLRDTDDRIKQINLGNECSLFSYKLRDNLSDLESLKSKVALIKEMPGQGKTNFVCDFSQNFLLKLDIPCVFLLGTEIDANDIRSSILKRVFPDGEEVTFVEFMAELKDYALKTDKCFVIIIDGLNENGNPAELSKSLNEFISEILDYDFVRMILTCRTEYYKANFAKLENSSFKEEILQIDSLNNYRYHHEDKVNRKLFDRYLEHFKIKYKSFSGKAYGQLVDNFLLLRIFCDAYQGKDVHKVENIYKEELFTQYFEVKTKEINDRLKLNDDFGISGEIDIKKFIMAIVEYMIKHNEYANIPLDDIIHGKNKELYIRFLDENILVRRDLQNNDDIFDTSETVNFTFDEFRDFLLSKYLISKTYKSSPAEFEKFLQDQFIEGSPIREGCGIFLFHASRKSGDGDLIKLIEKQNWYGYIFERSIFNLKDEYIEEKDRLRLFSNLLIHAYNSARILYALMSRTDLQRHKNLNIQHLFEHLRSLTSTNYDKAFIRAFSLSDWSGGLIRQNDILDRLKKRLTSKKFEDVHHHPFELLIYMFTNPNNWEIKSIYERYSYKFPDKAKEQLSKALKANNKNLVKEIKSFCNQYGIIL